MKQFFLFSTLTLLSSFSYSEYVSVHCPFGCPDSKEGNTLAHTHTYTLSNNPETKFADWVAYEVNPTNYGVSPSRDWANNPLLSADNILEENDYKKANKELKVDRGHQAPLASFAGSQYWYELNYLSNITPQKSKLNQGAWKQLEEAVRKGASFRDPLFVITGTIYSEESV